MTSAFQTVKVLDCRRMSARLSDRQRFLTSDAPLPSCSQVVVLTTPSTSTYQSSLQVYTTCVKSFGHRTNRAAYTDTQIEGSRTSKQRYHARITFSGFAYKETHTFDPSCTTTWPLNLPRSDGYNIRSTVPPYYRSSSSHAELGPAICSFLSPSHAGRSSRGRDASPRHFAQGRRRHGQFSSLDQ
jgi:hypothetical protein